MLTLQPTWTQTRHNSNSHPSLLILSQQQTRSTQSLFLSKENPRLRSRPNLAYKYNKFSSPIIRFLAQTKIIKYITVFCWFGLGYVTWKRGTISRILYFLIIIIIMIVIPSPKSFWKKFSRVAREEADIWFKWWVSFLLSGLLNKNVSVLFK